MEAFLGLGLRVESPGTLPRVSIAVAVLVKLTIIVRILKVPQKGTTMKTICRYVASRGFSLGVRGLGLRLSRSAAWLYVHLTHRNHSNKRV